MSIIRRQLCLKRKQLTQKQRHRAEQHASLFLYKLLAYLPHQAKIGLYLDAFGELPTQSILHFCQKYAFEPYLPITRLNQALLFTPCYYNIANIPKKHHRLGMQEPVYRHFIHANQLDMIICPLVAVDRHGNRLGMGGGYYDRTFTKAYHVIRVGWCYDFQLIDALNPNSWDQKVHFIITDKRFVKLL